MSIDVILFFWLFSRSTNLKRDDDDDDAAAAFDLVAFVALND